MPSFTWPTVNGLAPGPFNDATGANPSPIDVSQPDAGEFSLLSYVPTTLSNGVKNASRLFDSNNTVIDQNANTQGRAWYDVTGRISDTASSLNDALQNTLIKIIVLLVIASTVYLIFISKVTKAANA